jgi:preprotein translocase subunit SecE
VSRNRERAKERKERLRKQEGSGTPELEHSSFAADEANAAVAGGSDSEPGEFSESELVAAEEADASDRSVSSDVAPASGKGGPRFVQFLRGCWAELQRVQWPDRQQVGQGTAVTLGFVVVAGLFLGGADYVAKQIVDLII